MSQTQAKYSINFVCSGNNALSNLSNVSIANALRNIGSLFQRFGIGGYSSIVEVNAVGTSATGLITLSSFVANDTVTVAGLVLTGKASPTTSVQFKIGASDTATAANLAACINANTTLIPLVSAKASNATVLVTSIATGTIGNFLTLAISAHGSVSASTFGTGTGATAGVNGTVTKLVKGIASF
jgi:hypothetical protein